VGEHIPQGATLGGWGVTLEVSFKFEYLREFKFILKQPQGMNKRVRGRVLMKKTAC
jgi:hypothetical protein